LVKNASAMRDQLENIELWLLRVSIIVFLGDFAFTDLSIVLALSLNGIQC